MESSKESNWTSSPEQMNFKEEFVDSPESEDAVLILSYEGELVVVTREDDYRHEDRSTFCSSTDPVDNAAAEQNKNDLLPIEVQEKLEEIKKEIPEVKEEKVLKGEDNSESQERDLRNRDNKCVTQECVTQEADLPVEVFRQRAGSMFRCLYCHQKVKTQATLRTHILRHLENGSIRKCSYCDFMTALTQTLHEHEWKHTNWKPYKCPNCPFRCRLKSDLGKHKATHSYYKRFSCHMCSYQTKWRSSLTVHLDRHSEVRFCPHACSQCGQAFRYESGLRYHVKRRHSDIKSLQCDQCPFRCKTNYELNYHKTSHSNRRPFVCKFPGCKQSCKTKSDFTKHMKIHVNLKNHVCDLCGKGFKFVTSLKKHASVHSQERKFECWACIKKFKTASALRHHILLHKGFKPYRCDVCLKAYSNRNNLLHHKQVHEGERPFKCPICVYGGREMDHLLVHIGSEHMKDFTYVCSICRKPFGRSHQLQVHLKTCHRENMLGNQDALIYDPQFLDIHLCPENENGFGHMTFRSDQSAVEGSASSGVPFSCCMEPGQVTQKRKCQSGLGTTTMESVDACHVSEEVPTSSIQLEKKGHPPVIQIGTFGGIGFCMARKGSGFEFNLNKRGKKPKTWFMDLEYMTPADARRHKAFLKRKERESYLSQNGTIRTSFWRNFQDHQSKRLPVPEKKVEIGSPSRSAAELSAVSKGNILGCTRQRLVKEAKHHRKGNKSKQKPFWSSKTNMKTRSKVVTGEWQDQDEPDTIFEMEINKAMKLSLSEASDVKEKERKIKACCQQNQIDHNSISVRLAAETVQITGSAFHSEPKKSGNIFSSIERDTSVSSNNTPAPAFALGNARAEAGLAQAAAASSQYCSQANRKNNDNLSHQSLARRSRKKRACLLKTCSSCKEEQVSKASTKRTLQQACMSSFADNGSQKTGGKLPLGSPGQVKIEPVDLGKMWAHALAGQTSDPVFENHQASRQLSDHTDEISWHCSPRILVGNLPSVHIRSPLETSRCLKILLHDLFASPKVKRVLQSKGFLKISGKLFREASEGIRRCENLGGERPSVSGSTLGMKETHAESHGIGGMLVALTSSPVARKDPKVKLRGKKARASGVKDLKRGITHRHNQLSLAPEQPTIPSDECQPATKQVVQEIKPPIHSSGVVTKSELLQSSTDVFDDACPTSGVVHLEHLQRSQDLVAFRTENSTASEIQTETLSPESKHSLNMPSSSPPLSDSLDITDPDVTATSSAHPKKHLIHSGKSRQPTQKPEPISVPLSTETEVLKCKSLSLESESEYRSHVARGLQFPSCATAGHSLFNSVTHFLTSHGSAVHDVLEDLSLRAAEMQISSPAQENADLDYDLDDQMTDAIQTKQEICSRNDPDSLISNGTSLAPANLRYGSSDGKSFTSAIHSPACPLTSDAGIVSDVTSMYFQESNVMKVAKGTFVGTTPSGLNLMPEVTSASSCVSCPGSGLSQTETLVMVTPFSADSGCLHQPQLENDHNNSNIFQCTKNETVKRKVGRPRKVRVSQDVCDSMSSSLNRSQLEAGHSNTDVFECSKNKNVKKVRRPPKPKMSQPISLSNAFQCAENKKVNRKVGRPPKPKLSKPVCHFISKMDLFQNEIQTRVCNYEHTNVFQCAQNVTVKRKVGRPPKAKVSRPVSDSISKMDRFQIQTQAESSVGESKCNYKDTNVFQNTSNEAVKRKVGRPPKAKVSQPACHSISKMDTLETSAEKSQKPNDSTLLLRDAHGHASQLAPEIQENELAVTASEVSRESRMCTLGCALDTARQSSASLQGDGLVCAPFSALPSSETVKRKVGRPPASEVSRESRTCTLLADDAINVQKCLKRPKLRTDVRKTSVFASSRLTDSPKEGSEVPDLRCTLDTVLRVGEDYNSLQEKSSVTVLSEGKNCFNVNSQLENLSCNDAQLPAESIATDTLENNDCPKLLKRKGKPLGLRPDLKYPISGSHLQVKQSVSGLLTGEVTSSERPMCGLLTCEVMESERSAELSCTKTSHRKVGRPRKISGTVTCVDPTPAKTLRMKVGRPRKATGTVLCPDPSLAQTLRRKVGRPRKGTGTVGCADLSCTKTLHRKVGRPRKITSAVECAELSSGKTSLKNVGKAYKVSDTVGSADLNQIKDSCWKVGSPHKKETLPDKHVSLLLVSVTHAKGMVEQTSPHGEKTGKKNAAESSSPRRHRKRIQNLTPITHGHTVDKTGVEVSAEKNPACGLEDRMAGNLSGETHFSMEKQISHGLPLMLEAGTWKKNDADHKTKRRKNVAVSNAAAAKKGTGQGTQRTQNSAFKIIKPPSECCKINRGKNQEGRKKKKCLYVELDLGTSTDRVLVPKRRPGRPPRPRVVLDRSQTNLCFPLQESSDSVSPPVLLPEVTEISVPIDKPVLTHQQFDLHSVMGRSEGRRNTTSPSPPLLAPEPVIVLPSLPRCVAEDESDSDIEYMGADYVRVDLSAQQLPLHPVVSCQQSAQQMGNSFQHCPPSQDDGRGKEHAGKRLGHGDSMCLSVSVEQSSVTPVPTNVDSCTLDGSSLFDDLVCHCHHQESAEMQREISCTAQPKEESRPEFDVLPTCATRYLAGCSKTLVPDGDRSGVAGARFTLENSLGSPNLPVCPASGISQNDGASKVSWAAGQNDRVHEHFGSRGTRVAAESSNTNKASACNVSTSSESREQSAFRVQEIGDWSLSKKGASTTEQERQPVSGTAMPAGCSALRRTLLPEQADRACGAKLYCMHCATNKKKRGSFSQPEHPQVGTEKQSLLNWRTDVTEVATEPGIISEDRALKQQGSNLQYEESCSSKEAFVGGHLHQTSDDQKSLPRILGDGDFCKERGTWTDSSDQELPDQHQAENQQLFEKTVLISDTSTEGGPGVSRDSLLAGQNLAVRNLASRDRSSHRDLWTVDTSQIFGTCTSKGGSPKASTPESLTPDSCVVRDGGITERSPSEMGSGTEPVCFSDCASGSGFNEMEEILAGNTGSSENIAHDSQDISVPCNLLDEQRGLKEAPETAGNNCCFAYDGAQKPTGDCEVHERGPQNMHEASFDDVSWLMQEAQNSAAEDSRKTRAETSQCSWPGQNVVAPSHNLFVGDTPRYQQSLQAGGRATEDTHLVSLQTPAIAVWPHQQLHTPTRESSFDPNSVLNRCGNPVPELPIAPAAAVLDTVGLPGLVAEGFGRFSLTAPVAHGASTCFHDTHSVIRISAPHLTGSMLPSPLLSVSQALPMAPVSRPYPHPSAMASQESLLPYHSNTTDILWQACQHIVGNAGALSLADPGLLAQPSENPVTTIPIARETGCAMDGLYFRQEGTLVSASILACNDVARAGTTPIYGQSRQGLVSGWRQISDRQTPAGVAEEDVSAEDQSDLHGRNLENSLSLNYQSENIDSSQNQYDDFSVVPLCLEADEDCVDEGLPGLS